MKTDYHLIPATDKDFHGYMPTDTEAARADGRSVLGVVQAAIPNGEPADADEALRLAAKAWGECALWSDEGDDDEASNTATTWFCQWLIVSTTQAACVSYGQLSEGQ